ncbi:MAG: hypothetical protein LC750_14220, partial [Actinobacteria bacterium]|nr:hypothetical protein [Actinomycetota bacterium]
MGGVWLRARAELRSGWKTMLALGILVGIAGGLVIGAVAGARRTDSAYDRFIAASNTAQVLMPNGGAIFGFAEIDFDKVVAFPEVADSARLSFLIASGRTSNGVEFLPIAGRNQFVPFVSGDGKFDRVLNRMRAVTGRLPNPRATDEIAISYSFATRYHVKAGDTFMLQLFQPSDLQHVTIFPVGTGSRVLTHIVGVEAAPGELPPGNGYPPIHLTTAFYDRYARGMAAFDALAVKLKSDADLPAFRDRVDREGITPGPRGVRTIQLFSSIDEGKPVQRSIHVQAVALWLLALLGGISALLIVSQTLSRQASLESGDNETLRGLGMTGANLRNVALIRLVAIALLGSMVTVGVAFALSPLTPIGLAHIVEPRHGSSFDVVALGAGAVLLALLVVVGGLPGAIRAARPRAG